MTELAIDDQTRGQLHEPEVVRRLLLPPDQQAPEAIEPTVTHLHYPATWRVSRRIPRRRQRVRRAAAGRNLR